MISAKETLLGKSVAKGGSPFLQQALRVLDLVGRILVPLEDTQCMQSINIPATKLDVIAEKLSAAIDISSKRLSKALIISRQDSS